MSRLTDACDRLEERLRRFAPDVDVTGLARATDDQIADADAALAPLAIPEELREYWSRFGKNPPTIPTLHEGEWHGETDLWDVGTAVRFFGRSDPRLPLSGFPGPANLVPIASVDTQIALAEIDPGSPTCRIWLLEVEGPEIFLILECIAELVELLADDLNVTDSARHEESQMWIDVANTPALHPDWFAAEFDMPSIVLDLYCRFGYAAPSGTPNRSIPPWPEYWISRPWPEEYGKQPDDWLRPTS